MRAKHAKGHNVTAFNFTGDKIITLFNKVTEVHRLNQGNNGSNNTDDDNEDNCPVVVKCHFDQKGIFIRQQLELQYYMEVNLGQQQNDKKRSTCSRDVDVKIDVWNN